MGSTKVNQIITTQALKHYTLLSKLMIKLAFVKFQLNRREILNHKNHKLTFYKMRHIIGCLEQYISFIIVSFYQQFMENLEEKNKSIKFSNVRDFHDQFISDIFSSLGSKKDGS